MSTWKRILTTEDGTLATSDQTIEAGENRNVTTADNTLFTIKTSNVDGGLDNGALIQLQDNTTSGALDVLTLQANTTKLRVTGASNSVSGSLSFKEPDDIGSHMITLAAPSTVPNNLTFTLPGTDGDNGEALVTDGSGNLSFSAVSGSGTTINNNADDRVITGSDSANTLNAEDKLTFGSYTVTQQNSQSTNRLMNQGVYIAKSNGAKPTGYVWDTDNSYGDSGLDAGSTGSAPYSNTGQSLSLQFTSSNLTQGRLHMLNASGALITPQANAGNTSVGLVGLYLQGNLQSQTSATLLMQGMAILPNTCFEGTFSSSGLLYLSDTTAGKLTYTIPSSGSDIVRHMGYALRQVTASSTASTLIYFNPSVDFLEIA
jgi:hypothetical protein